MLFETLLVLLAFTRAQDISPVVNITECSVERLTLRVLDKFGNMHYLFIAACKDHGTCVDGKVQPGIGVDYKVGSLLTLPMGPNCNLGNTLSPSESGRCTLLISSSNALHETDGSFTTDCTLSPTVSSTAEHSTMVEELSSFAVKPNSSETNSTATTSLLSTPELVTVIVVPLSLLIMLLTVTIVMNFVIMRMRYAKIRSRRLQFRLDFHENDKWNTLFNSKDDDISRDDCTIYDSVDLNEEESDSVLALSDELCIRASGNCNTDSTAPIQLPLQTTCHAGYIQGQLCKPKQ